MTRILITRPLPPRVIEEAEKHFEVELRAETTPLKPGQMKAAMVLYDGVLPTLGDLFNAEVFAEAENARCQILANFGVGYNHIDVAAAKAQGITVINTPGAVTDATADIALMLMLMLARRAREGEILARSGAWAGWHPTQMLGTHMSGKTVGIIGMGRIGQAIARRCHAGFGMEVIYFNRSEKDLAFPVRRMLTLEALGAAADFVVTAVPGGAETQNLVSAPLFEAMKPTGFFVNIARGDVVDEPALIAALEAGRIAGAGLDVYAEEPVIPSALMRRDDVVLLPHLGTAALEVREAMGLMAVENLRAFFAGEVPPNVVT